MGALGFLLLVIFSAVVFIIIATNYLNLHPLFALLISAFLVGFLTGMDAKAIVGLVTSGFGSMLSSIGLVIVFGTVIGVYVEKSGALDVLATFISSLLGSRYTLASMTLLGAVVSVPVFCDSGFIILSKLSKALARKRGVSSASLSLGLAGGLYTTHTLIPPTPGPIAVAGTIQLSEYLGSIILTGLLVSIPVLLGCIVLAKKLGDKIEVSENLHEEERKESHMNVLWAIFPILLPILLITLNSLFKMIFTQNIMLEIFGFVGSPVVALMLGTLMAMVQVRNKFTIKERAQFFKSGVEQAGPIVLITGAGGAFGAVLKGTNFSELLAISLGIDSFSFPLLILTAFALAAILKTAQGSSTSALVIASAILAPLIPEIGSASVFQLSLLVMAFGAGAMTVSHANDSYFWVVTQFSGFSVKQGYRGFTLMTLGQGLITLLVTLSLYAVSTLF